MPSRCPDAAASAVALFGVERHRNMPALPHALGVRPAPVSNAVSDGPHASELVEAPARGSHAGGDGVRVIRDVHRGRDAAFLERRSQLVRQPRALHLRQIGRFLHHPRAHEPRDSNADRVDHVRIAWSGISLCQACDMPGEKIDQFAVWNRLQRFQGIRVAGIAEHLPGQPQFLQPRRRNVVCDDDADRRSHVSLQ